VQRIAGRLARRQGEASGGWLLWTGWRWDGKVTVGATSGTGAPAVAIRGEASAAAARAGLDQKNDRTAQARKSCVQVGDGGPCPAQVGVIPIFTLNATGVGQAAVVNLDGSINGAGNPAPRGSVIQVYAIGAGAVSGAVTGSVTTGVLSPVLAVTTQIGGVSAHVILADMAPSDVSGVLQVNVVVPPGTALPLNISVSGTQSQTGATIAVE